MSYAPISARAEDGTSDVSQGIVLTPVAHRINSVLHSNTLGQGFFKDRQALLEFYSARGYEPLWIVGDEVSAAGRELFAFANSTWTHGLNPLSYHTHEIYNFIEAREAEQLGDLELVLTDAFIRIGHDLSGIRVNPAKMDTDKTFWKQPLRTVSLLSMLLRAGDGAGVLEQIAPQGQTYELLREELQRLMAEEPPEYEGVLPIKFKGLLRPYDKSEYAPALRLRLGVGAPEDGGDPYLYDDKLAAAVVEFQRYHGVKPDGIVGNQTLDLINIGRNQKIEQIIANLERLRWVPESKPPKYVVVNIPSATVWAVEDGRVAFEMPVIVGKSARPTNTFITEIHGVRFNPTWTVPPTIKKEDILPELQENPGYLAEKGMELMVVQDGSPISIDPLSVDWLNTSPSQMSQFSMVQVPGDHNPLGRIRILMPNRYNIYLHDTNKPQYFDKASRALSSGCVRMYEPEKMANFIMSERKNWGDDKLKAVLGVGEMRDLYLEDPIPVYMLYYTVWINDSGQIVYGRDLYGNDQKLVKDLSNVDGIFKFVDNNSYKD